MSERLSERDRDRLIRRGEAFISRLYHLNPIPEDFTKVDGGEMYYRMLPDDVGNALRGLEALQSKYDSNSERPLYLLDPETWLSLETMLTIREPVAGIYEDVRGIYKADITFKLPTERRMLDSARSLKVFEDNAHYPAIHEWGVRQIKLNHMVRRATDEFRKIAHACNTAGQWNRVFPQFTVMLDNYLKSVIGNSKRKSPWPKYLDELSTRQQLPMLVNVFARCAVLPEFNSYDQPMRIEPYWQKKLPEEV